jgi:hypothetical protein
MTASARIDRTAGTITLQVKPGTRSWQGVFPITDLPATIAFYARLRDRKGGAYARHYAPTVEALERCRKDIERSSV